MLEPQPPARRRSWSCRCRSARRARPPRRRRRGSSPQTASTSAGRSVDGDRTAGHGAGKASPRVDRRFSRRLEPIDERVGQAIRRVEDEQFGRHSCALRTSLAIVSHTPTATSTSVVPALSASGDAIEARPVVPTTRARPDEVRQRPDAAHHAVEHRAAEQEQRRPADDRGDGRRCWLPGGIEHQLVADRGEDDRRRPSADARGVGVARQPPGIGRPRQLRRGLVGGGREVDPPHRDAAESATANAATVAGVHRARPNVAPVTRMDSPSAMITNSPHRSAKWCAETRQSAMRDVPRSGRPVPPPRRPELEEERERSTARPAPARRRDRRRSSRRRPSPARTRCAGSCGRTPDRGRRVHHSRKRLRPWCIDGERDGEHQAVSAERLRNRRRHRVRPAVSASSISRTGARFVSSQLVAQVVYTQTDHTATSSSAVSAAPPIVRWSSR